MAGLVPAIHVFLDARPQGVDARDKPGHDGGACRALCIGVRKHAVLRTAMSGHDGRTFPLTFGTKPRLIA